MARQYYKDSQTGNMKPLGVKVEDTLPVGTIVEYTGSTIPEGWVEVEYETLKVVTLYESSNGSKSNITLSDNVENYDYIEIFYRDDNNTGGSIKYKYRQQDNSFVLFTILNFGSSINIDSKGYTANGNTLSVRSGRYNTITLNSSGVSVASNDYLAIIKVLGYIKEE